ncbi:MULTISPECIES: DUF5808 domain-containing protein [Chitinophagaceae]
MQSDNYQDSQYWKWGIFYYNKNDKRLFPRKRNPWMGWTVNFANPKSILVFLVLVAVLLGIVFWLR